MDVSKEPSDQNESNQDTTEKMDVSGESEDPDAIPELDEVEEDFPEPIPIKQEVHENVDLLNNSQEVIEPILSIEEILANAGMTIKDIFDKIAREKSQGLKLKVNMSRGSKLARKHLKLENERLGRITIQDFLSRQVDRNEFKIDKYTYVAASEPQPAPLKIKIKRRITCGQCPAEFENESEYEEHFDNNHSGLSMEDGTAFRKQRAPKRKVETLAYKNSKIDAK